MKPAISAVKESNKFHFLSSIWMVPLSALLISLWLIYQYYASLGNEISIYFEKNSGLKAGRSQVKYKDIVVGKVKDIVLKEDGDGVLVTINTNEEVKGLINKETRFWIVRPEIGLSGISGLDTLFSGSYINMYSDTKGPFVDDFIGLENAHYNEGDVNFFRLRATPKQRVSKGMVVYYNGISIGQVQHLAISPDGTGVDVSIHIESDYLPYVHKQSQFWLQSLINIGLSDTGLEVKVAPLNYLISGGITLSTLGKGHNKSVPSDFIFTLHDSEHASNNQRNTLGQGGQFIKTFRINTTQNVAKLGVGAAVNHQHYKAGKVLDIKPVYDILSRQIKTTILLSVDTSIFASDAKTVEQSEQAFYQAITQGLLASIDSVSPITDSLFVNLVFSDELVKQQIVLTEPYPTLPTTKKTNINILDGINKLIDKLGKLPLEGLIVSITQLINDNAPQMQHIVTDLEKTMAQVKMLATQPSFPALPQQLTLTMTELRQTLNAAKTVLKRDKQSVLAEQVTQTLKSVTEAAQELEEFLILLNRKPNALVFGEEE